MKLESKPRPGLGLFGDVLASGVLVGLTAVVNLLGALVFARALEPVAFGLFATCRRIVAFSAPLMSLGGHLGISRYLGYYAGEREKRAAVVWVAFALTLGAAVVTILAFLPLHRYGQSIEWVGSVALPVWLATVALAIATAAGLIVFSMLRGFRHPRAANLHQLMTLGIVVAIGLAWRGVGVAELLGCGAASGVAVNAGSIAWLVHRHRESLGFPSRQTLRRTSREVLSYGIVRIGDGPLQASLSLVGVVMAPAIGGLALAGYIHISQTIVRVTEIVVVPLSVVFLPVAARCVRDGRLHELRGQAQIVFDAIVLVGACGTLHGLAWGQVVLNAAFGERYSGALPYLLCTLPSILPFLLFAGFRGFIDGYSRKPANTVHLLLAGGFVVAASAACGRWADGLGLSVAYTVGVAILGALTVRYVRRHFGVLIATRATVLSIALALTGGAIGWGIAASIAGAPGAVVLTTLLVTEAALVAASAWLAWRWRHTSVLYVVRRLRQRRTSPAPGEPNELVGTAAARSDVDSRRNSLDAAEYAPRDNDPEPARPRASAC